MNTLLKYITLAGLAATPAVTATSLPILETNSNIAISSNSLLQDAATIEQKAAKAIANQLRMEPADGSSLKEGQKLNEAKEVIFKHIDGVKFDAIASIENDMDAREITNAIMNITVDNIEIPNGDTKSLKIGYQTVTINIKMNETNNIMSIMLINVKPIGGDIGKGYNLLQERASIEEKAAKAIFDQIRENPVDGASLTEREVINSAKDLIYSKIDEVKIDAIASIIDDMDAREITAVINDIKAEDLIIPNGDTKLLKAGYQKITINLKIKETNNIMSIILVNVKALEV
ncbi:hypothetical protein [Spiroplasma melliferum]|uniref:hypothetical protein n=1 Tax=Spiroplasma melliferum TaxID=2134 RepID=UPI0002A64A99|nr:hypothetical protein [Spiroplasma melliferum]ELL44214.1 hypothetical protein SMIPMB4A_v3c8450 [Spiroplasma melliferum IPMB4A]